MVEIFIQDTGPGIPVENRTRIFEPFVSTKKGGTGLGLTVSYGIIAAHGGNLDLVVERGPGACFRVALPLKEKP
jgi:two-component system NtrC family sensor kinase